MNRFNRCPGPNKGLCASVLLVATFAMLAGGFALVATPAVAVAAEMTERVMPSVEATLVGPSAFVNTLGLRATTVTLAGRYITIAEGRQRIQARVANQLFAEFGVFRDVQGRFKLLGADGGWVKLLWSEARKRYEAGTWANRWAGAWSFKLQRPTTFGDGVLHDLADMQIDSLQVVCVTAYTPLGAPSGLLAVSESGVMLLRKTAKCGDSTSSLFITDSLRRNMDAADLTKGVRIDPVTYVRFVPPDRPALSLSPDDRRLMRDEVFAYFNMLANHNEFLRIDILLAVNTTMTNLLIGKYTIPGDKAKDVNLAKFFVNRASYMLDLIPVYGTLASNVVKATYDTVELGITLAHNQNLDGPRYVERVTNKVLTTATEIAGSYHEAYTHFGINLENLRNSILEGCTDPDACTSDRKLAAWRQADPMKDVTSEVSRLMREHEVAGHELVILQKLLPIRGLLYAHPELQYMPSPASSTNCNPGYPRNSAFRNEDVLDHHATWTTGAGHPTLGVPLVTTAVYYPYYNWYQPGWCAGTDVHRAYRQGWIIGLADDDPKSATPIPESLRKRLFNAWDPGNPRGTETGFELSRSAVACGWLSNRARGYMGRAGYYFDPCHFAFHDVTGAVVSPYQSESPYGAAAPWSVAYWTADPKQVAAGRLSVDPERVSPLVPRLEFGSCAAFDAGDARTVTGGAPVKVYFTNLHDGAVDVYRIRPNGSTVLLFTVPRQDQLARPLPITSKGPLPLAYSRLVNTTSGTSFLVRRHGDNACIGTWAARKLPAGAPVDYAVAEVHGSDGILYKY